MRLPEKLVFAAAGAVGCTIRKGSASTLRSSDMNRGLEQKAVTPASRASSSTSAQSYAVRMMMGAESPMTLRMRRTVSMPFISGIIQSTI